MPEMKNTKEENTHTHAHKTQKEKEKKEAKYSDRAIPYASDNQKERRCTG